MNSTLIYVKENFEHMKYLALSYPICPEWRYALSEADSVEDLLKIHTLAEVAYLYARFVLIERFPEGESAIATSAEHSYRYARFVLHDRFPEGEDAIATGKTYSSLYNKYVT